MKGQFIQLTNDKNNKVYIIGEIIQMPEKFLSFVIKDENNKYFSTLMIERLIPPLDETGFYIFETYDKNLFRLKLML